MNRKLYIIFSLIMCIIINFGCKDDGQSVPEKNIKISLMQNMRLSKNYRFNLVVKMLQNGNSQP
ncbi:hypothetical protein DU508_05265 [Pedobacter chinensis]|uniref:Uncharacterized protein n=1 Tax=Pedobacter chinensis TaxID=2282421 RepID=A0A369Q0D2_9SPHI|nr:hypothetical protein DU508_05265 [Pedobacter chinensis]